MRKILHVLTDTNIGGAGKLLLVFLANFNRELFDVKVVAPEGALIVPEIQELGIETVEVPGIGDKSFSFKAIKKFKAVFEELKPDIVHTHAALSARIAAKRMKIKVIHTRHCVYTSQAITHEPAYKKRFPYKQLAGAVNNYLSDVTIATSPVVKMSLMETGTNQRKTVMVYNAIDGLKPLTAAEKADFRDKYGIARDDFVCTIVARLEKVKGHEYVLKAAQLMQREDEGVKFIIAGIGGEETSLKHMAAQLGLKNCIFTGFVGDVREVLGITHLQINASHTETTNLALLEGLSLGVPAIVTDAGGNPFVINDGVNGILFESKDYAGLHRGIMSLKGNPELYRRLCERALEIFHERFTAAVMTSRIEDIYRGLLGEQNG